DHPLEVFLGEVEIGLDRWQGNVQDRRVEHNHELRHHDHGEYEPAAVYGPHSVVRRSLSGHRRLPWCLQEPCGRFSSSATMTAIQVSGHHRMLVILRPHWGPKVVRA